MTEREKDEEKKYISRIHHQPSERKDGDNSTMIVKCVYTMSGNSQQPTANQTSKRQRNKSIKLKSHQFPIVFLLPLILTNTSRVPSIYLRGLIGVYNAIFTVKRHEHEYKKEI